MSIDFDEIERRVREGAHRLDRRRVSDNVVLELIAAARATGSADARLREAARQLCDACVMLPVDNPHVAYLGISGLVGEVRAALAASPPDAATTTGALPPLRTDPDDVRAALRLYVARDEATAKVEANNRGLTNPDDVATWGLLVSSIHGCATRALTREAAPPVRHTEPPAAAPLGLEHWRSPGDLGPANLPDEPAAPPVRHTDFARALELGAGAWSSGDATTQGGTT